MKAKKAMKTFICILVVVLAVSLTACENNNGADEQNLAGCKHCRYCEQFSTFRK